MKGLDILEAVNEADRELLTVNVKSRERRVPRARTVIAIAAAAVIALASVTVGAIAISRGSFSPITEGTHGFHAEFELSRYDWSAFKGDIKNVGEIVSEQYAAFTPAPMFSNIAVVPGCFSVSFDTYKDAAAYVGLDALKTVRFPFGDECTVAVYGESDGRIKTVDIESQYVVNVSENPEVLTGFMKVHILTENSGETTVLAGSDWGDYDPGSIEFGEFNTSTGVLCQYAEVGIGERTRQLIEGYVLSDGILYSLSISFEDGKRDEALGLVKSWAEEF